MTPNELGMLIEDLQYVRDTFYVARSSPETLSEAIEELDDMIVRLHDRLADMTIRGDATCFG